MSIQILPSFQYQILPNIRWMDISSHPCSRVKTLNKVSKSGFWHDPSFRTIWSDRAGSVPHSPLYLPNKTLRRISAPVLLHGRVRRTKCHVILRVAMETSAPLPWQSNSFPLFLTTSPYYLKNYDKPRDATDCTIYLSIIIICSIIYYFPMFRWRFVQM